MIFSKLNVFSLTTIKNEKVLSRKKSTFLIKLIFGKII
jgi:hypothetical protein